MVRVPGKRRNNNNSNGQKTYTVEELQAQVDNAGEAGRTQRARLERIKRQVFQFEAANSKFIVLYTSGEKWYKVGGHSLLFYLYNVAPRLGYSPRLKVDTDFYATFTDGVIVIPQDKIASLTQRMAELGIKRRVRGLNGILSVDQTQRVIMDKDAVVIYELPHAATRDEIRELSQRAQRNIDDYNEVMGVKAVYPQLMGQIRRLTPFFYSLCCTAPQPQQGILAEGMFLLVKRMRRTLTVVANGRASAVDGLRQVCQSLDYLSSDLTMALDAGIVGAEDALKNAKYIRAARKIAEKEYELAVERAAGQRR